MIDYSSKYLIKRIIKEFVRPYFNKLSLAIFFMVLVASTTALHAWMMKPILDKIFTEKSESLLLIVPIALLLISIIRGFAVYMQDILTKNVENDILLDVQRRLFAKILQSDLAFLTHNSSGKIISHFTNDINMMRSSISLVLTNIIREFLSLVFLLALIFYYLPKLAIITFCIFPLAIYPVYYLGKKMRKISANTQKELSLFTNQIDETVQGIRVVKAYNAEEFEKKRLFKLIDKLQNLYRKSVRTDSLTSPLMESLGGIALAAIIWYGGHMVIEGSISTGSFFLFITAVLSAYRPMKSLTKLNNQLQMGLAAAKRIFEIFDVKHQVKQIKNSKKIKITEANIKFTNISFAYPGKNNDALTDISFELKKNHSYALVGKSGSGKSTIMNLLLRFYDVSSGNIKIDNHDIKNFSFSDLRSQISYVSQDIFLFDDTVRANICYGLKRKISESELIKAAHDAEAYEFIKDLKDGFDTFIGSRGNLLSGGQKQRIVLARAFLKNSPILLLDEATSALDPISEKKVQNALSKLKKNRTCLIIAHRLSTIMDANLIMVLHKGKIVATGTHAELIKNNEYYKSSF
jgi:subfamily B ATP-binding cassette protein MsbA